MATPQEELEALLAAPSLPAPDGVTPNFDNPPNRNALAYFVTTFCIFVATLCLLLRAYIRTWKEKRLYKEEVLMFLSYGALWATAYAGYGLIETPGYYVHQWHLTNGDLVRPFWSAILLDWSRLFVHADKRSNPFWWGCVILGGLQCGWGIACIIFLNMQCRPHRAIWEFYLPDAKCYDLASVMLGSACVQVVTDVCMVLLPQRIIWTLQMNLRRKIGVSVIFAVGLIACVAACFRLADTVAFAREADKMYFIGPLLFWAWAEMSAGFFIFCVPCLPKLIAESKLPSRIKSALGISRDTKAQHSGRTGGGLVTIGGTGGSTGNQLSKSGLKEDRYHKIHDDGVIMTDFGSSESQEELQEQGRSGHSARAYR